MTKKTVVLTLFFAATLPMLAQNKASDRIGESTAVLKTILEKQKIPKNILDKALCVLVYPGVKKASRSRMADTRAASDQGFAESRRN